MSFRKFESLLNERSLYFRRMDLLDDKFEGSMPKSLYYKPSSKEIESFRKMMPNYDKILHEDEQMKEISSKLHKANLQFWFINCWHVNESESAAMWQLYLKSNKGIAVQSTFKRLKESIVKKENVNFGLIHYVDDYDKEIKPMDFIHNDICFWHVLAPFIFKRKCFEHEKELRAFILTAPSTEQAKREYATTLTVKEIPEGLYVKVNLEMLIEKVLVSPTAKAGFENSVKSIIKKHGLAIEVVPSSLADNPIY